MGQMQSSLWASAAAATTAAAVAGQPPLQHEGDGACAP